MQKLNIKVAYQIQKQVSEVFEAIVNPEHMCGYFISYGSGRMVTGKSLIWRFPEFEGDALVRVSEIIQDQLVSFFWDNNGIELKVSISLKPLNNDTVVTITEGDMDMDDAGIEWLKGNTEGWANFLCCLKAYLEYGINLRKGGFEFRKTNK